MSRVEFTEAEVLAIPVMSNICDDIVPVVDPTTGLTEMVRKPVQFLVRKSDVLFYRLSDGTAWSVGETAEGQVFRSQVWLPE